MEAYRLTGWKLPFIYLTWLARPRFYVIAVDLAGRVPDVKQSPITSWSKLGERDVSTLGEIDPAMTVAEIRRRQAERQECHLAWIGAKLAHYRWQSRQPTYLKYLGLTFRPSAGQVCVYDTYTAPQYRRSGIETAARAEWHRRHRKLGFITRVAFIAWWNKPSMRALDPIGARVVGSIGYWNLWPWRRYFATGAVRLELPTSFSINA